MNAEPCKGVLFSFRCEVALFLDVEQVTAF